MLATRSRLYPDTESVLGWDIGDRGFRIVLGAELPEIVELSVAEEVRDFLADHDLKPADVTGWVCHPGGPKVLDALAEVAGAAAGRPGDVAALARRDRQPLLRLRAAHPARHARPAPRPRPAPRDCCSRIGPGLSAPNSSCCAGSRPVTAYTALVLLVAVERLAELAIARRNAAWSRRRGGTEYGRGHYPAMVALHTGLLAGCLAETAWADRPFLPALGWPMLALVLAAQALRWWCITTLGPRWNTRVIVVPGLPLVAAGPYRLPRPPQLRRGGRRRASRCRWCTAPG